MEIKQISVFFENKPGRIAEVIKVLADEDINLRAISIADTADFGILRLIVNDHEKAAEALNNAGFTSRITNVAAVEIEDKPGNLAKVMDIFKTANVNIEYLYASLEGKQGKAAVIFKLEDHEKGLRLIKENNLSVVNSF